ncbi:cell division protein ZapA [Sphingomonas aerolata]|uniref:cell division protein ZapA n=1 Tax=Sphingomonas aerolata TaxID=185951 RepID=UPI002FE16E4B
MLDIGGRPHAVACRDGEESRVRLLGAMLAERWPVADRAAGGSVPNARCCSWH